MRNLADRIGRLNEDLQVERYPRPGALILFCRGALSLVSHRQLDELYEQIRAAAEPAVVLDLREVGHVDSTGIGTLAMSMKHCMAERKKLALVPNDAVRQALATASLDTIFAQYDSVDDALARLAAGR